jgi:hypothetical protein
MPAGDPDALLFGKQPSVGRWRAWFGAWAHVKTIAFICEDILWRRSSDISDSQASQATEGIVQKWLTDSPLENFEIWSGADSIQLSRHFQITYARFHNIHGSEPTRHRYSFQRDQSTRAWILSPPTVTMRSAISQFHSHVCDDGCWICIAAEAEENLEDLISYLDDVREEDWHHRLMASRPWLRLHGDPIYRLSV